MLFMTRKRFEEEVQRRVAEAEENRYLHHRISGAYDEVYKLDDKIGKLEHKIDEIEGLIGLNSTAKERTRDDEFFVTPSVGEVRPKQG